MNIFNSVNLPRPFRSKFFPTHERVFSCQMGRLIPTICEEVLPDDKWSIRTSFRLELAPLIAPLMHNIDVYQYFFYVPNYLLSSAWPSWISQGEPADSPNIPFPARFNLQYFKDTTVTNPSKEQLRTLTGPGSLLDYLGFSNEYSRKGETFTMNDSYKDYSTFPFLAYHAVWLNYFRNENFLPLPTKWGNPGNFNSLYDKTTNINLSDWKAWNYYYRNNVIAPLNCYLLSGDEDSYTDDNRLLPLAKPRKANFMHDYFTASLPFTQRGPVVRIPIGETAPISGSASTKIGQDVIMRDFKAGSPTGTAPANPIGVWTTKPTTSENNVNFIGNTGTNEGSIYIKGTEPRIDITGFDFHAGANGVITSKLDVDTDSLEVDLSEATGVSILDLRRFARLQAWLEKNAIGGNNPGENIRNHFGVKPSDSSLDKPVFLGGGRVPLSISNVLQTSQSSNDSPQANPSGYARAAGYAGFRNRYFREHGWIIGLLYVMPRSTYMQGTRRFWDRKSRFDYFWMEFERIGEQPVYGYEIYDDGTNSAENNGEFGYNPRYADYKFIPNSVHGDFKTSLSFWHAARIFSSRPKLNNSFLHLGEDINRIFAVSESVSNQNCWFWTRNTIKVRRPMLKNPTSILG